MNWLWCIHSVIGSKCWFACTKWKSEIICVLCENLPLRMEISTSVLSYIHLVLRRYQFILIEKNHVCVCCCLSAFCVYIHFCCLCCCSVVYNHWNMLYFTVKLICVFLEFDLPKEREFITLRLYPLRAML